MTNQPERSEPQDPDRAVESFKTIIKNLESILEELKFTETPELAEAKEALTAGLIDADTDPSTLKLAWGEYEDIMQDIVESSSADSTEYAKSHIAESIYKALMFRSVGNMIRYAETLDIAETFAASESFYAKTSAENKYFDDISRQLVKEINDTIDTLPHTAEKLVILLRGYLSDDSRLFLRDLINDEYDLEDVRIAAYNALLEEGNEDPEELLTKMGDLEPNLEA